MKKTVERELKKIVRYVERETGCDISDFLYDAHDNYEYDEDGNPATCDYIIRGLWNEADMFMYTQAQNKKTVLEKIHIITESHPGYLDKRGPLTRLICMLIPENANLFDKSLTDVLPTLPLDHLEWIYTELRKLEKSYQ